MAVETSCLNLLFPLPLVISILVGLGACQTNTHTTELKSGSVGPSVNSNISNAPLPKPLNKIDGRYRQVPEGTRFYIHRQNPGEKPYYYTVENVDGYYFEVLSQNNRDRASYYTPLKHIAKDGTYKTDNEKTLSLWPLQVGKSVKLKSTRDGGVWVTDTKITNVETLSLKRKQYNVYVTSEVQKSIGGGYRHEKKLGSPQFYHLL